MFGQERLASPLEQSIRELRLLDGERIEEQFVPESGTVHDTPLKGSLLVLTNRRVISFVDSDGRQEAFLAPLEELKGVSVKADTRGFKDISLGLVLIVIGILSYLIIGYIQGGPAPFAIGIGLAIVLVGIVLIARYFIWEEGGSLTFQGGTWEWSFPYRSSMASVDVYYLVNRFFQIKLAANSHTPPPRGHAGNDGESAPSPSPHPDYSYDI